MGQPWGSLQRLSLPGPLLPWLQTSRMEAIFNGNCAACHAGGNNSVVAEKKLKKEALITYGKYSVALIIQQATNGNGAIPAFGDKLAPEDIEDVATYVLSQADKGWS